MPIHPGQDKTIERLLEAIHRGEYAIPYFQRGFEWTPNMVKDLFSSILANYFTGLLLFWELDSQKAKEKLQEVWGAQLSENVYFAILDGQQRLSSLYYAIYNPNKKFPDRQSYCLFFIDLEKYFEGDLEECVFNEFRRSHTATKDLKTKKDDFIRRLVFPLALLSDKEFCKNQLKGWIHSYADELATKSFSMKLGGSSAEYINKVMETREELNGIRDLLSYEFTTHVLSKDKDVKDICLIFAKLNQKGLKLSAFDLMNAFLYPRGITLRKDFSEISYDKLKQIDEIDDYLLKAMALAVREYSGPSYVYSLVPGTKVVQKTGSGKVEVVLVKTAEEFKGLWNDSIKYCERARWRIQNVSDKCFGAIKIDYIPNTTIIPVFAMIIRDYENKFKSSVAESEFDELVSKWYWSAVFSQDYSGSSDSVMAKDYRELKQWLATKSSVERTSNENLTKIISELRLAKEKKGTSVYNAIISLIALNKAPDFFEQVAPGSVDYADSNINDHHIFPSQVKGLDSSLSKQFAESKDNIVNRTLLFNSTNSSIGNHKPSKYLEETLDRLGSDEKKLGDMMAKHFVSETALNYLWGDDFDRFIEARESTMKSAVQILLKLPPKALQIPLTD